MKNKKIETIERVVLSLEATQKLDKWIEKVTSSRQGVDLSRRKLVDWLIMNKPENLSSVEEKEIADLNYNEVRFLKYAIKEIEQAQERGEKVDLAEFLQRVRLKPRTVNKSQSARLKADSVEVGHE
ncbi:MAG: hypothetical protein R3A80_04245 [Bdellovibrionota bacterium]